MSESWKWKSLLSLIVILAAVYILVPSVAQFDFESDKEQPFYTKLFPEKTLNLGLDLRGGMYLEMNIDMQGALKKRVDLLLLQIERTYAESDFPDLNLKQLNDGRIEVNLPLSQKSLFFSKVKDDFGDVFVSSKSNRDNTAQSFFVETTDLFLSQTEDTVLKQAEEAVRNRIDRFGVVEASIFRQGSERLIVELPGVNDPDRVVDVIRKTGLLEFKLVDDSLNTSQLDTLVQKARNDLSLPEGYSADIVEQINKAIAKDLPEGTEVLFEIRRDPVSKQVVDGVPYLLKKRVEVTGDMLRNAQVNVSNNEPYVSLSFNKAGTKTFAELTKANIGKRLAIILDKNVNSAPVIQSAIPNGEAQITLGFGSYDTLLKESEDLSLLLREGALPASLEVATKTVIGPSLGKESIEKGITSLLIAALIIIIFMMVYYKLSGILANFALILNVVFIFAILSLFQASLTLPGIAGIVLTLGMAVDANIIIFERMREEKRLGKTAKGIIEGGYGNAMSAIIDANITTLISGVVLFQFGTGPIKGFATTLIIGVLTTLFTAIVLTRLVFDYFLYKKKIKTVVL